MDIDYSQPVWRRAFPAWPADTAPAMPKGYTEFTDQHMDRAAFCNDVDVILSFTAASPALRGHGQAEPRFCARHFNGGNEQELYSGDSWDDAVAAAESFSTILRSTGKQ